MKKFIVFFIAFVAFTSLKAQNAPQQPQPQQTAPAKPTPSAEGTTPQNNDGDKDRIDKISGATKPDKQKTPAAAKSTKD
jgi:hypothetical protein